MTKATKDPVLEAVLAALPDTHLAVWSKVKNQMPDIHPAEVWRCMANSDAVVRDPSTGVYARKP